MVVVPSDPSKYRFSVVYSMSYDVAVATAPHSKYTDVSELALHVSNSVGTAGIVTILLEYGPHSLESFLLYPLQRTLYSLPALIEQVYST